MARVADFDKRYHAVTLPLMKALRLDQASIDSFRVTELPGAVMVEWVQVIDQPGLGIIQSRMLSKITIETTSAG